MILTKAGPGSEAQNTFNLPTGGAIRTALVAIFRDQHAAVLAYIDQHKSWDALEVKWGLPLAWPSWDSLGLGVSRFIEGLEDSIKAIWEKAGAGFLALLGLDPDGWDANDPKNLALIERGLQDLATEVNGTTSDQLQKALDTVAKEVTDGRITTDQAETELTKDVNEIFGNAEDWRARMIAVTEASRAYHQAIAAAAREFGEISGWQWKTNGDPCAVCLEIEAECQFVPDGRPFAIIGENPTYQQIDMPPAHPSCCLPGTPIVAPLRFSGIVAQYNGPVVRLIFSDGSDVAVTPNHMLLTTSGFSLASSLVEGDEVIRYCGADCPGAGYPHDNWKPALIEEVVESLSISRGVTFSSVPASAEDLHRDAAFCEGKIDIVSTNSFLSDPRKIATCEDHCSKGGFGFALGGGALLSRSRDLASVFLALRDATDSGVGSLRESKARLGSRNRVTVGLAVGTGSGGYAHFQKSAADYRATDAERLRDCLLRFPDQVTTAKVIKIDLDTTHYVGPVYDVQTTTSLYLLGNGIASSNCMCTAEPVMAGDEPPDWGDTLIQPTGKKGYAHEAVLSIKAFPTPKRFPKPQTVKMIGKGRN